MAECYTCLSYLVNVNLQMQKDVLPLAFLCKRRIFWTMNMLDGFLYFNICHLSLEDQ